jgi:integrase
MPRASKGPRLELKHYKDRSPRWIIRDGQQTLGTGCDERDRTGAERKLAEYILKKHDPAKALDRNNPNQTKIADVLSLEMQRIAKADMPDWRKKELISLCQNMGNWFGDRSVGDLDGELQERYASERRRFVMKKVNGVRTSVVTDEPAPIAAYRDLKILAAAINRYLKKKVGGVQARFSPVLPDAPEARERWLTRDEAARLIRFAWRQKRETVFRGGRSSHYTSRHIARFVLVGLYTGSRHGDICGAALMPTIGRGYVDLDRGIFTRKPDNKKATSKRQPTVPVPPRLLAHMRRWKRLGIGKQSVIEFNGKPISRIRSGWDTVVKAAGLATADPKMKIVRHTMRHTAITWYLTPDRRTGKAVDIETVSQYCGVSVATIRKTYRHVMPGTFDPILDAAHHFGR